MTDTATHDTPDVKSALAGFADDFRGFRSDLDRRLARQTERLDALDRKAVAAARPGLSRTVETNAPHRKAFAAYIRQGDEDRVRHLDVEEKALGTAVAAEGGVLVDPQTATRVETVLRSASPMRALARTVQVDATAYDALIDHTEMGADWITEASAISETATPAIDRISIPLHELNATPKPARLLGYPVVIAEEMPDITTDATPIAFGDFRSAYTIAERPDLRVLRDPYSAKPHVLFYATKRVGGDVTDFAAIKLLKFSA